jgi:hypothetical protein
MGSCHRTSPERNALERLFDLKDWQGRDISRIDRQFKQWPQNLHVRFA